MGIELGYALLHSIFQETIFFNVTWLISIALTGLTLLLISRDPEDWKKLALPVMTGWHIVGIAPFIVVYLATGIFFITSHLGTHVIGQLLTAFRLTKTSVNIPSKIKIKRRPIFGNQSDYSFDLNRMENEARDSYTFDLEELRKQQSGRK